MLGKTFATLTRGGIRSRVFSFSQFSIMNHQLVDLPFEKDSLEPFISSETIDFHYGKHHQGYVNLLNDFIKGEEDLLEMELLEIIKTRSGKEFNLASQIFNHDFFWNSLSPNGGGEPVGELATVIDEQFGSYEEFKTQFKQTAATHFGSGWTWLCEDNGKLEIIDTHDAGNPITIGKNPLLVVDVWEHAYYVDYRNNRGEYLDNFWDFVNWEFGNSNFVEHL